MAYSPDKLKYENLPGHVLLALARNDSASPEMRRAAVELMIDNRFAEAKHPELSGFVADIRKARAAKDEVEAIVETAIEGPIQPHTTPGGTISRLDSGVDVPGTFASTEPSADDLDAIAADEKAREATGPFKASVTTKDIL